MTLATWITRPTTILLVTLATGALTACSTSPIKKWQATVERHVIDNGQGDLNALRTGSPEGDRFDFVDRRAKLTEMFPSNRQDVHAVILSRTMWENDAWQVFLLGVVHYSGVLDRFPLDAKDVNDIRLAATRVTDSGTLDWIISDANEEAVETYLRAQGDNTPAFPTARDKLDLGADGSILTATDENSGATWTLDLNGSR